MSVVPWADEAQGVVCRDMAAVVQVHSLLTKSSPRFCENEAE